VSGDGVAAQPWPNIFFYLAICIGDVTGVTGKWIVTSFCPALSFTTKAAPISSTVHGGGGGGHPS
jgi:hypothetical protein